MPTVQFIGAGRADQDNSAASPGRLINCYREPAGDKRLVLKSVPGMTQFAQMEAIGRAIEEVSGIIYAASGGRLFSVDGNGSASALGAVADDAESVIAGYGGNVLVTAGGAYQVFDGVSLDTITGGAFARVGGVAYLSGWTILTEQDGARFEWTALNDPKTRNALHVATAEGRDDKIVRPVIFGGNLYIMKQRSTEIWALTGAAGANAFARLAGGVVDRGLLSRNLVVRFDQGIFFVGNDGAAYLFDGSLTQVSTPPVQTSIAQSNPTHCFHYEDEGRKFCVIRFENRPAWVLDLGSGEWFERAEGNDLTRWGALASAKAFGRWHVMDAQGRVSRLARTNADFGETMIRRAVSAVFETGQRRFVVREMEAKARTGWGGATLTLRTSKDGGLTWGAPKSQSLGGPGDYTARQVWRNLGQFRRFTAELTMADATEAPIYTDMELRL